MSVPFWKKGSSGRPIQFAWFAWCFRLKAWNSIKPAQTNECRGREFENPASLIQGLSK
ncbi:hypothetical protein WG899_18360 [Paucibacter sp. AS339]|uniref:hypothetical protein n=1 Tax=Paucibacter hankyongi TaxID=3133434 RepID=UPI00309ACE39